jgi:hypothetical protein
VEHLVEAAAAGKQVERLVEDEERLGQCVDDRQRKRLRLGEVLKLFDRGCSVRRGAR